MISLPVELQAHVWKMYMIHHVQLEYIKKIKNIKSCKQCQIHGLPCVGCAGKHYNGLLGPGKRHGVCVPINFLDVNNTWSALCNMMSFKMIRDPLKLECKSV